MIVAAPVEPKRSKADAGGPERRTAGPLQVVKEVLSAFIGIRRGAAHENDAERAIRAALSIAAGDAASSVQTDDLDVHIGIATGVVVVGNLPQGGEDISAIGGAPNLAARLEALAKLRQ